jgi:hypothetical protein
MMGLSRRQLAVLLTFLVFGAFSVWWLVLQYLPEPTDFALELFSGTYGVMALLGALIGWKLSRDWGGRKSTIGRAILMFSFGLLAQEFGQITYSLYTLILHQEIPYPSIGDIGYFGSIFFYIYGVWLLGEAVGAKISLKSYGNKLQAVIIPGAILAASYWVFLKGYEFDWSQPLTVFLDLGYPLGQAVYISLAILAFTLSRKFLGGMMRPVILFVLFALAVQYLADFMFLYQTYHETWTTAGLNDYVYLTSYFIMTLALLQFKSVAEKIKA